MSLLRIDEIFNFEKGILQSSKCVPGEYNFITASSDWKTHNEYTHDCEALVFAAAASGSLGRTHYVNGKFISSDLCFIITPKDQQKLPVDLKFYHILFNELKDEIVRNTKAGTSKEAIGLGSFGKYQLPYFDIDTQIEIKNRFVNSEEIKSDLSNELNHQIYLVKKLRQQLLQDAVQGKLVPQDKNDEPASELLKKIKAEKAKLIAEKKLKKEKDLPPIKPEEIPFEIPENWVWCRLQDICLKITDGTHFSPTNVETGKFKYITAKNIKDSGINLTKISYVTKEVHQEIYARCNPEYGDILYIKDGATTGVVTINDLKEEFSMLSSVALIKLPSHISNRFLMHFMRSPFYYNFTREDMSGVAITRVTLDKIQKAIFPLAPFEEQNRIVQKLDKLMQYCNELEASIKECEIQNEKLLQQVLREALRKEPVEV
jgi:type I restriction enzyme S subunit